MNGTYLAMPAFPKAAGVAVRDTTLLGNPRHATYTIRDKRAKAVAELSDWSELREAGKQVKDHKLQHPKRLPGPGRAWTAERDLPQVPARMFRAWWKQSRPWKAGIK
nr:hypothetical protein [Catenulispora rubra]